MPTVPPPFPDPFRVPGLEGPRAASAEPTIAELPADAIAELSLSLAAADAEAAAPEAAAAPAPAAAPPRYIQLGQFAQGGSATLHVVRDTQLERILAMKLMLAWGPPTEVDRARFIREALVTAGLEHPGIVPIHERGEDADGVAWFTMKKVRGDTFDKVCRPGGDLRRLVDVLLRICDTLIYAHAHGVLHRDIKPANIMIGAFGEVYVMDWGIARRIEEPETRRIEGTPSWLAPEQARGERNDERTDVYAIGGLLYHALCGARPHPGDTSAARMAAAARTPVRPAQEVAPHLPPELCRIAMRALAFDPADRYPTVAALRADLDTAASGGWWLERCSWPAGTTIVREGEDDKSAWIIMEGTATVTQGGRHVRTLGPGDTFGELALLCDEPRTATVVAETDLAARVIRADVLEAALAEAWLAPMLRGLARRLRERETR